MFRFNMNNGKIYEHQHKQSFKNIEDIEKVSNEDKNQGNYTFFFNLNNYVISKNCHSSRILQFFISFHQQTFIKITL